MKKLLGSLMAVSVLVVLAGCSATGGSGGNASDASDGATVGVVLSFSDYFYAGVRRGFEEAGKEADSSMLFAPTEGDAAKESDAVANFISRGVDAIAIAAISGEASVSNLQAAQDAGIPVVCYDGCIDPKLGESLSVAYVQSDQYALGAQTGAAMKTYIEKELGGEAKIATLNCNVFPETCGKRFQGMKDALADLPGVQFIADQEAYEPDKAQTVAENILTANTDVDIFWASNEGGTVGAVNAVAGQGREDEVVVFGTDMSPQIAQFLLDPNGILKAVTGQDPVAMGKLTGEIALKAAAGEDIGDWIQPVPVLFYDRNDTASIEAFVEANPT